MMFFSCYTPLTELFAGLVALRDINLSHNHLRTLQNRTHGLFQDCLSIRNVCSHASINY